MVQKNSKIIFLQDVINNDALTLLEQDKAIGELLVKLLTPIQNLLNPFLQGLNLLNFGNLLDINQGLLGLVGKLLKVVLKLVSQLLGGLGNTLGGLTDGLLGNDGLLGGVIGDDGLLENVLGGGNGLLGGLTGGRQ